MEELQRIIPNSEVRVRKGLDLKKIIPQAKEKGFTALVVVNEDRNLPSILLLYKQKYYNGYKLNYEQSLIFAFEERERILISFRSLCTARKF